MCTCAPAAVSRRMRANTAPLSSRLDRPWLPPARMALATSDTGSAGTTCPTSRIDQLGQRKGPAEADAGVAVAVPGPPDPLPQALGDPCRQHQRIEGEARTFAYLRG